jgi:demethylmenaquinone methyltransferase/2-methoxy-6-polyprenyl-1,4-benzoquinol methylase
MFDRIAPRYDLLNRTMTAGLDGGWRRAAAAAADLAAGDRALDVCTGTGDLAIELAHRTTGSGAVVGVDFSEEMVARARAKAAHRASPATFRVADALALPFAEDRFDAATVAFGIRNVSDLDAGLAEMARVVKPGGRVVVLEITTPRRPPLSTFYRVWFDRIVPLIGRLTGETVAYSYLPSSVRRFQGPEGLAASMQRAGMRDIRWILTAGGIIAIHAGTKA